MIHLEEIDENNWRLPLQVAENQKTFVSPPASILARAYAYRHSRSMAYVIYAGEEPVGMAMYHDCDPLDAFDFSQLFIDERYQRRGYGRAAVRAILDLMKADGKYRKVVLCYIDGNDAARRLYESFGFRVTDRDEDEIIMELKF